MKENIKTNDLYKLTFQYSNHLFKILRIFKNIEKTEIKKKEIYYFNLMQFIKTFSFQENSLMKNLIHYNNWIINKKFSDEVLGGLDFKIKKIESLYNKKSFKKAAEFLNFHIHKVANSSANIFEMEEHDRFMKENAIVLIEMAKVNYVYKKLKKRVSK